MQAPEISAVPAAGAKRCRHHDIRCKSSQVGQTKAQAGAGEGLDKQGDMAVDHEAGIPLAERPHLAGCHAEDEVKDWCHHQSG